MLQLYVMKETETETRFVKVLKLYYL